MPTERLGRGGGDLDLPWAVQPTGSGTGRAGVGGVAERTAAQGGVPLETLGTVTADSPAQITSTVLAGSRVVHARAYVPSIRNRPKASLPLHSRDFSGTFSAVRGTSEGLSAA